MSTTFSSRGVQQDKQQSVCIKQRGRVALEADPSGTASAAQAYTSTLSAPQAETRPAVAGRQDSQDDDSFVNVSWDSNQDQQKCLSLPSCSKQKPCRQNAPPDVFWFN